ncbi:hypothetical protein JHK87_032056 [Glycine soja]|nr:hypothetical protein JHK87_032056 [Glycine soja]
MAAPARPLFVLFGSSIVQLSFSHGGWGSHLSDIYSRKADILLRGYYGWNSRRALQVLNQVFPKDAAIQPSLVIVYFGGNDSMGPHSSGLGPHVPLHEYIENMRKILIHIQGLSEKIRIIVLSCPPVNEEKVRGNTSGIFSELVRTNELCQSYSEACIKLCKELDVKVVDLFNALQKRDDWMNACFTPASVTCLQVVESLIFLFTSLNSVIRNSASTIGCGTCFSESDGIHLAAEGSKIVVKEILRVLKEAEWEPCLHWKSMPTEFAEDSPYDLVAADGKTTLNPSEWTFYREIQWD